MFGGHTLCLMIKSFVKGLINLFILEVRRAIVLFCIMPCTQETVSKYLLNALSSL